MKNSGKISQWGLFINQRMNLNPFLTASEDRKQVIMTQLDTDGKELWQDSIPAKIDEYEIGKLNCITEDGRFVFGAQDGNFYCLHPRKAGEIREEIEKQLDLKSEVMQDLRESIGDEEPVENESSADSEKKISQYDDFVIIGGVKLEKKKKNPRS